MDIDDKIVAAGILLCCLLLKRQRRRRRFKTRLINRRRTNLGFYNTYFKPMKSHDEAQFFKYTRMSVESFDKLLGMLLPYLQKRRLPDRICPEQRLAMTLHYFSQGLSMQKVAWTYHVGHTTVHQIIKETARAIWEVLSPNYLKPPSTEIEWQEIASDFETMWKFPHCIGALGGKHINIQASPNSGSVVLLACCDANYNFTLIDVGAYGGESESIFNNSSFGKMMDENKMSIPAAKLLPNSNLLHPFTLVADEVFSLRPYILTPYPEKQLDCEKRIFNYRLCRARRVIENTFGILVNRWRLLRNTIVADVDNINLFIKAILCLHNYANKEEKATAEPRYCPPGFVDSDESLGAWRDEVQPLASVEPMSANRSSQMLKAMRDNLKSYFVSPAGQVPWQNSVLD